MGLPDLLYVDHHGARILYRFRGNLFHRGPHPFTNRRGTGYQHAVVRDSDRNEPADIFPHPAFRIQPVLSQGYCSTRGAYDGYISRRDPVYPDAGLTGDIHPGVPGSLRIELIERIESKKQQLRNFKASADEFLAAPGPVAGIEFDDAAVTLKRYVLTQLMTF